MLSCLRTRCPTAASTNWCLLFALAVGACAPTEAANEPAPPAPTPPEIAEVEAPHEPAPGPNDIDGLVGELADAPEGARLGRALEQITNTMADMRSASARAAEGASSPCDAAYRSLVAANEVVQNAELPTPPPTPVLAPRPRFMQLCATLPEVLQRCGRFDYRSEHNAECSQAYASASPEHTRAMMEMARLDPEG